MKRVIRTIYRTESALRKIHLGSSLRLQKVNSLLAFVTRKKTTYLQERVLISMSTFNGQHWVEAAIKSVLNQSYENFHLLIVDDGSTDATTEVISSVTSDYEDKVTTIFLKENMSPEPSTNVALDWFLKNDEYDVFTILDQDDVAERQFLEIGLALLNEKVQVVRCKNARFNESLTKLLYTYPACSQLFIRREVIQRLGLRKNHTRILPTDTEYLNRIEQDARKFGYAVVLTWPICQNMRIHGGNMILQQEEKSTRREAARRPRCMDGGTGG